MVRDGAVRDLRKTYLGIWPFFWEFGHFLGNFGAVSAHVHFFLFFVRKRKRKVKMKKRKRRGRAVKGKGVTNCWDFRGNFIIFLGKSMGIRPFSNSQNSQLFWGIPQKLWVF